MSISAMIAFLRSQISPLEVVAAITGLLCVWLSVKNNIWNWLWGLISVILYTKVFYDAKLFSSTGLQLFYFLPMQFIGWWVWMYGGPKRHDDLPVTMLSNTQRFIWFAVNFPMAAVLGFVMGKFGAALSYTDALVTAMSITAQYLQTVKRLENWILWIAVDLLYSLYILPSQKLWVSCILYVIFTIMAFLGWKEWLRIRKKSLTVVTAQS